MKRIVFFNNDKLSIIVPNVNIDLNVLAKKHVPKGLRYKILNIDEIPSDRTFREAWEYNFENFDGYGEAEL
jgi:hypothetical protein